MDKVKKGKTFQLTTNLINRIDRAAKETGLRRHQIAEYALNKYLKRYENRRQKAA